MRNDVVIDEVLDKCNVLKKAGFWLSEPKIRPRVWLQNFEKKDQATAAQLLDKFTFYNGRLTKYLLIASYHSIGDGLQKGPKAPDRDKLINSLDSAAFTPVTGEKPNPTDSGYYFCRMARQELNVPEEYMLETKEAVSHAYNGDTVVFLDDFIGSGDQFLETWTRQYGVSNPRSFADARAKSDFTAIYITLVTTDYGLDKIHTKAPEVAVCATHVLDSRSTIDCFKAIDVNLSDDVRRLLRKYSSLLTPKEKYILNNPSYLALGYKNRGLLFGFEHSIPDSTLPIFWSPGTKNWEPLIERK